MPITLLDVILLVVMMVSALLAMVRGFMREILSIASWAAAAGATIYAYPRLLPVAKQYFTNDYVAMASVVGGVFVGTLLVVSILTIKISDVVLDSRVGALDRTLAFLFFAWLVPDRSQPEWVRNAKSKIVLQGTGEWLKAQLPDDPESTILKRLKKPRLDEQEPQDAPPAGNRSKLELRPDRDRHGGGHGGVEPDQRGSQQFANAGMPQPR